MLTEPVPALEELATRLLDDIPEGAEELIPGLIPRGQEVLISGETNIGKSLTALEIVSSLITSRPLWGQIKPTSTIKKVLYVLGEHHVEVIQKLHRKTELPMTDQVYILGPQELGFDKWLVSQGRPNLMAVEKFKRWAKGCDFIVFDPLSAFCTGVDTENDNIQMRLVLDTISLIAQSAGASYLVLAHQGKPMMDQFGREQKRKTYATRGASATEDAATNVFYLTRSDGPVSGVARDAMVLDLICRKFKGEAPPEYKLLRDSKTLTHTLLGNNAFREVQKFDYNAKLARIQVDNPGFDFRTALKVLASVEGLPVETLKKRIGLTLD